MPSEQDPEIARADHMTTEFFENVLTTYLEDDRIESGVLRLNFEDGDTRRLVVDDDTESLDPQEYIKRELAEVMHLINAHENLAEESLELSIPVADESRVIEEAQEEGSVSTLFQTDGIVTLLEQLQTIVDVDTESIDE